MNGKRIAAVAVLVALVAGALGITVHSKSATQNDGMQVVAAENFWVILPLNWADHTYM